MEPLNVGDLVLVIRSNWPGKCGLSGTVYEGLAMREGTLACGKIINWPLYVVCLPSRYGGDLLHQFSRNCLLKITPPPEMVDAHECREVSA